MNIINLQIKLNSDVFYRDKKIKQHKDKDGYSVISITHKNKTLNFKVHRLVAEKYIPNPENKPYVNHINGIKADNRIENLEWVTPSENNIHAYKLGLMTSPMKNRIGDKHPKSIPICQISKDGFLVGVYESAKQASDVTGKNRQMISKCRVGKRKSTGGYIWA